MAFANNEVFNYPPESLCELQRLIEGATGNTSSGRMCSCVECVPSGPDGPTETSNQLPRDEERTMTCLLLVCGVDVPPSVISTWTDEQCEQVEEWAMANHLDASDNNGVVIPEMPECIKPYIT